MKKYKTLILLLILCMIVCIFAGTTYAWFVKVKRTGAVYFKTGEVEYSIDSEGFDNNFVDKKYVVPGENLIKENSHIYFNNHSSISSSVRLLIVVVINEQSYVLGDPNSGLLYEMVINEGTNSYNWEHVAEEVSDNESYLGYWYYRTDGVDSNNNPIKLEVIPPVTAGSIEQIAILKVLKLDGSKFGNSIASEDVQIQIYFQAKQADYASWESIGQISTTLGE